MFFKSCSKIREISLIHFLQTIVLVLLLQLAMPSKEGEPNKFSFSEYGLHADNFQEVISMQITSWKSFHFLIFRDEISYSSLRADGHDSICQIC
jgi:hypothetical protein